MVSLFNCRGIVHEQDICTAVELGANDVDNTASSSLSLARTGGDFEKAGAPVYGTVDKHTEVRNVGVVGLPGCVKVEVEAMVAGSTLREVVEVDLLCSSVAQGVEVRHKEVLAAKHEGLVFDGVKVVEQLLGALIAVNRRVMHKAA
eukprot:2771961-Pleurochrysis_carterae.AAC.2